MTLVALLAFAILLYAGFARRLSATMFSSAMIFTVLGVLASQRMLDLIGGAAVEHALERLLEVTLVMVLFADAFSVRSWDPRRDRTPVRLLLIGMPLTIAAGWVLAMLVFPNLDVWEAAALAAVLAPTDAALGIAVVSDARLPRRVRQALNVESGLNDGLALPFLTIFVILAAVETADVSDVAAAERFFRAIVLSGGIGIAVAWFAGRLLTAAYRRGWTTDAWVRIGLLAAALIAYGGASIVDGSGFIGAWVAGFVAGRVVGREITEPTGFVEDAGSLFTLAAFFSFGALMVIPTWEHFRWEYVTYALLSLTVVRIAPVMLSLVGTRLRLRTTLFMGWFGPRGLASLVFVLLLLGQDLPARESIFGAVTVTVLLSVILHGASSVIGVSRYAGWFQRASAAGEAPAEIEQTGEPKTARRLLHPG